MAEEKRVLAFDFGASSGRAVIGVFDGRTIRMKEIHRFSNDPVIINGTMYWDILRLFHEVKQGLIKAHLSVKTHLAGKIDSIGVDTWGVDFGLLDKDGMLLENPVHYRDSRTNGMLAEVFKDVDKQELYEITGNQLMEINTLFQLKALADKRPDVLKRADTLLLMPDLFNYFLCGAKKTEYSIASTTQLLDAKKRCWSDSILNKLNLPAHIFTEIVPTATRIGRLSVSIAEELGMERPEVIAVAGHDTQSAMAAVPTEETDFLFLSCGTWSLLGTELSEPIINERSLTADITNEGGYGGKASFLKNIIGLWLIQESRRQWIREGKEYSFGELELLARQAKPFQSFIHPDAPEFVPGGNMPERIREYCRRTGQPVPRTPGEIVRCIDESLAMRYRQAALEIESCTQKEYATVHMIGGGIQSQLLCQLTANACQKKVTAGPVEATVIGNIALQLLASGAIKDIQTARRVVMESEPVAVYEPKDVAEWEKMYRKWEECVSC